MQKKHKSGKKWIKFLFSTFKNLSKRLETMMDLTDLNEGSLEKTKLREADKYKKVDKTIQLIEMRKLILLAADKHLP